MIAKVPGMAALLIILALVLAAFVGFNVPVFILLGLGVALLVLAFLID